MKGLSKKDIPVVVLCLCVVLLALVYSFIWMDGREKIEELKAKNEQLSSDVAQLREKASDLQFYRDETARMKEEIDAIYSYFPANVLMEDGILSAMELEEGAPMISAGIG